MRKGIKKWHTKNAKIAELRKIIKENSIWHDALKRVYQQESKDHINTKGQLKYIREEYLLLQDTARKQIVELQKNLYTKINSPIIDQPVERPNCNFDESRSTAWRARRY